MDVLNDTKLLEGNPHLILEGRHWCSRRFILVREVIGLIVLTLLLIRLQGGHSYTGLSGFLYGSKTSIVILLQPVLLGRRDENFFLFISGVATSC